MPQFDIYLNEILGTPWTTVALDQWLNKGFYQNTVYKWGLLLYSISNQYPESVWMTRELGNWFNANLHTIVTTGTSVVDTLIDDHQAYFDPWLIAFMKQASDEVDSVVNSQVVKFTPRLRKGWNTFRAITKDYPNRIRDSLIRNTQQLTHDLSEEFGPDITWAATKTFVEWSAEQSKAVSQNWLVPLLKTNKDVLTNGIIVITPAMEMFINDLWEAADDVWDAAKITDPQYDAAVKSTVSLAATVAGNAWNFTRLHRHRHRIGSPAKHENTRPRIHSMGGSQHSLCHVEHDVRHQYTGGDVRTDHGVGGQGADRRSPGTV